MLNKIFIALIVSVFVFSAAAECQISFFKHIDMEAPQAKPQGIRTARGIIAMPVVTLLDSTFYALRPITMIAYSWPHNEAMVGGGVSLQNITYNYEKKNSYVNYSASLVYFGGGSTSKEKVSFSSVGIMFGALNNAFMLGAKLSQDPIDSKWKGGFVASIGYNLN